MKIKIEYYDNEFTFVHDVSDVRCDREGRIIMVEKSNSDFIEIFNLDFVKSVTEV